MLPFRINSLLMGVMASVFITMPALAVKYPIKTSTNGRYLVDSENKPFFLVKDFTKANMMGVHAITVLLIIVSKAIG